MAPPLHQAEDTKLTKQAQQTDHRLMTKRGTRLCLRSQLHQSFTAEGCASHTPFPTHYPLSSSPPRPPRPRLVKGRHRANQLCFCKCVISAWHVCGCFDGSSSFKMVGSFRRRFVIHEVCFCLPPTFDLMICG